MDIRSEEDLQNISDENRLDLQDNITITDGFESIKEFEGVFDGHGYTISGLETTFIETLKETAVVKNVTFKDISLDGNSRGIFIENHGVVKSVSVTNLVRESLLENQVRDFQRTAVNADSELVAEYSGIHLIDNVCTPTEMIHNSIGGFIGFNTGTVEDCRITHFDIDYQDDNNLGGVGCLIGFSLNGKVKNCIVNAKSNENSLCKTHDFSSAICGFAVDSLLTNCESVNFTDSELYHSVVSGIFGFGSEVTVDGCKMKDWEIDIEGTGGRFLGLCNLVCASTIKNCEVSGMDINDVSVVTMVYDSRNGIIKDCRITDCDIFNFETDEVKFSFSSNGTIERCFSEKINVRCRNLKVSSRRSSVTDSYITIDLESTKEFEIRSNSSSFMVDIAASNMEDKPTIEILDASDLKDIEENSMVKLTDDIDMSESSINISVFEGFIDGNGYTLLNVSEGLFETLNNATIKDIVISEPKLSGPIIAENIVKSKLDQIEIIKKESNVDIDGSVKLAESVDKSSFRSCSVDMNIDEEIHTLYGICRYMTNSKVYDCNFTFRLDKVKNFYAMSSVAENTTINSVSCNGKIESFELATGLVWNLRSSEILNSSNSMDILQKTKQEHPKDVGGICGRTSEESIIRNCEFTGSLDYAETPGAIGGIVGDLLEDSVVEQSTNKGDIYSNSTQVGGLVGRLSSGEMSNCLNTGSICGKKYIGGLVGLSGEHEDSERVAPFIQNSDEYLNVNTSKNHGDVSGGKYIGGLIGFMENTDLENCYTYGDVSGDKYSDLSVGWYSDNCTFTNILVKQKNEHTEKPNIGTLTDTTIQEMSILIRL